MQILSNRKSKLKMPTHRRRKINYFIAFVLLASVQLNQITCTSSYIGDYFLPTAKLALNKIQQSLSPTTTTTTTEQTNPDNSTAPRQPSDQQFDAATNKLPPTDSIAAIGQAKQEDDNQLGGYTSSQVEYEPNNKTSDDALGTTDSIAAEPSENAADKSAPIDNNQQQPTIATVLSSTDSTSSDPTAATTTTTTTTVTTASKQEDEQPEQVNNKDDQQQQPQKKLEQISSNSLGEEVSPSGPAEANQEQTSPQLVVDNEEATTTTTTTTSSSTTTTAANIQVDQSQPAEQNSANSIRDTELEAIAAVDATIAFGTSSDLFSGLTDNCYDEYGNARFCEPEFENIALERPVWVSSECGQPASRFCATYLNERNDQIRNCHICDQQHPKKRHPAAYLTDLNNPASPTCWVSAPIGQKDSPSGNRHHQRDNVTLSLKLGKTYEITYISLQFCSLKPDSLVIYRSQDFGSSWSPYQFYSSQCKQLYGLEQQAAAAARPGQLEPICTNAHHQNSSSSQTNRIAFSTLEATNQQQPHSAPANEKTANPTQLSDWMTSTDVRIVLDRHQSSWIQSNLGLSHHHSAGLSPVLGNQSIAAIKANNNSLRIGQQQEQSQPQLQQQLTENSLLNPSDTYNYAISDLTVGGRCKCNGHASRCVHGLDGELQCDCRHNTAGRDCDRCASFHFDRPWQPANQFDANPCQPCQCNGHSRRCKFDPEIYQLSGKRSGGVCIQCQDNTAGRHCHYCVEGFTRDHSRLMSDPKACKPCDCHPVGSLGRVCNQTTGQCPCKEGVTGLECNRCAAGYQQSSSPSEPCIKLPENDINYEPTIEQVSDDPQQQNSDSPDNSNQLVASPDVVSLGPEQATDQEPSILTLTNEQSLPPPPNGADSPLSTQSRQPAATSGANQRKLTEQTDYPNNIHDKQMSMTDEEANEQFLNQRYNQPQWPASKIHHLHKQQQHNQPRHNNQYLNHFSANKHNTRPSPSYPFNDDDDTNGNSLSPTGDSYGNSRLNQFQDADNEYPVHRQPHPTYRRLNQPSGVRRISGGEMSSLVEPDEEQASYPVVLPNGEIPNINYMPPSSQSMLDVDENDSFNQINHPQHIRKPWNNNGRLNTNYRHRPQHTQRARRPINQNQFVVDQQQNYNNQPRAPPLNNINCADCQSATKKLSVRQFCHLDYAIKATVLNKVMAEDWTRVDVEIQDIFKSSNSNNVNSLLKSTKPATTRNFVSDYANENLFLAQADDPNAQPAGEQQPQPAATLTASLNNSSSPATGAAQKQQQQANSITSLAANYRLRVGSTQSIWVPTEDISCKCPKLKLKSTYLLMGLVDSKENAIASIQLDRHGVALEWKSSLLDKLMKYQKRQAKRGC